MTTRTNLVTFQLPNQFKICHKIYSLISKDISDRQFIAQLITTLEIFDAKIGITTDSSLDMFYASNAKIVENSMQALEPLVEGDNTFANQYNSYSFSGPRYVYTLPVDFVQEVHK